MCAQLISCAQRWDPQDCSPQGSSLHGILHARILKWVPFSFSRGSPWPRDWSCVSCIAGRVLTCWVTGEAPKGRVGLPSCFKDSLCLEHCYRDFWLSSAMPEAGSPSRYLCLLPFCNSSRLYSKTVLWVDFVGKTSEYRGISAFWQSPG